MADYMVNGLDIFAERFKDYSDNFIIVGGTACSLAMNDARVNFRATNDIDMIVIVEHLSSDFGKIFWDFIKDGGYEFWKSNETTHFFRFLKPKNSSYPKMIELFSRKQDWIPDDMVGTYTKHAIYSTPKDKFEVRFLMGRPKKRLLRNEYYLIALFLCFFYC